MFLEFEPNQPGGGESKDAETYHGPIKENSTSNAYYLGPATVCGLLQQDRTIEIRLPSGAFIQATMAVAGFYCPQLDDTVLVISQEKNQAYIIGILSGSGLNTWTVPGDLVVQAPEGNIQLECAGVMKLKSRQKTDIISPRLALRATRLELSARRLALKVDDAYLWVKGLFQLKSRNCRTVAEENFLIKSKRARMKSEGDFNINGKTIHLG